MLNVLCDCGDLLGFLRLSVVGVGFNELEKSRKQHEFVFADGLLCREVGFVESLQEHSRYGC